MNTKFSFSLIVIVIVIIAAACAPTITDSSGPAAPVEPADQGQSFIMPVTGDPASTGVRAPQEPQQWSGEIFLSDNNGPDVTLQNAVDTDQQRISECMSEDSQPRRQSGCTQ
jgi:hypothetical protein